VLHDKDEVVSSSGTGSGSRTGSAGSGGSGRARLDNTLIWYKEHTALLPPPSSRKNTGTNHPVIRIKDIGLRQVLSFRISDFSHVQEIAKRVGRTEAHVIYRWSLQTGAGVIPCTFNVEHMKENAPEELLGFELDEKMMWKLNSMWRLMMPLTIAGVQFPAPD